MDWLKTTARRDEKHLSFGIWCVLLQVWWYALYRWQQGPVSLRLMTSQFKDIVTHTQKYKTVKCTFCGVWVHKFVWNFKGALWNFTQNFEPIHCKICILRGGKNLTTYDIFLSLSETGPRYVKTLSILLMVLSDSVACRMKRFQG